LNDALDVRLGHLLANLPVHDRAARAVQQRAQVVERAGNVEVRDVDVPVLVCCERLYEAGALLRRLGVPSVQSPRRGKNAIGRRRADRHDVTIDHHERQSAIPLERVLVVEQHDLLALFGLEPVVAGDERVVLVRLAIPLPPVEELTARHVDPPDESVGRDLGLFRPRADEVDDLVARIVRDPPTFQGSPRVFFTFTNSSEISAITASFLASLASSCAMRASSCCFSRS
jgi:hypothetical protein